MDAGTAVAWCATHGLVVADREDASRKRFVHAPITLGPYDYPLSWFRFAVGLAPLWGTLCDRIAREHLDWLVQVLEPATRSDDFTKHLVEIARDVLAREGGLPAQSLFLGMHRSDYMLHEKAGDARGLLQVEFNTISSSFGGLSDKVAGFHAAHVPRDDEQEGGGGDAPFVPVNQAARGLAKGLAAAHAAYVQQQQTVYGRLLEPGAADSVVVLMTVQPGETNVADQRHIEFALWDDYRVRMVRCTLAELAEQGSVDPESNALHMGAEQGDEVAVVYLRSGYSPDDYPTEAQWDARRLIEHAACVKCPSIGYHLVGAKKVQQVLAEPDVLERFMSQDEARGLRSCFAGLYPLDRDDEDVRAVIADAISHPEGYVMKPQREGGGNNLYGEELKAALSSMDLSERSAYILMERILPPAQNASLMRGGEVKRTSGLCELGIFSVYLADSSGGGSGNDANGSQEILNEYVGYLLRVKPAGADEGGVAAGYAVLSSPRLCGDWQPSAMLTQHRAVLTDVPQSALRRNNVVLSATQGATSAKGQTCGFRGCDRTGWLCPALLVTAGAALATVVWLAASSSGSRPRSLPGSRK